MGSRERKGLRVVFDTNVVVSALLFKTGRLSWLRRTWSSGGAVPLVNRATVDEMVRVLSYPKFQLESIHIHDLLAEYLPYAETVVNSASPIDAPQCKDPDDQVFLEVAFHGQADVLVSGDKALLELRGIVPFEVMTPAGLKLRLGQSSA